ncbi:unnamed protein product [marine sediment metagenome]|uniref:Polyprenyl synthetase n=1 Tax=marine sediment metagenome TaxID=412755 RepID=X0ZLC5_9ZZZZ
MDVYFTGKKISKKKLEYMHRNKTGKIITASVRCAAILCGVIDDYLKKFTEYSENLGLAFQITDDILDVTSDKCVNTFPNIWGISKSKEIARDKIDKAIAIIKSMDIDYKWLVNIANFLLVRKG